MPANISPLEAAGVADRRAERIYQSLVDGLDAVVFRVDGYGHWSYLSPAWQERLGWPIDDSIGRPVADFVRPDDRGNALRGLTELLAGTRRSFRRELRFVAADGGERWMLVSARGQRGDDGLLQAVSGTLTDVSAEKAAEAELIAARAAAEVANKAKSEFLSTMSHELRTPLNAVIGLSESLLEAGAPFDPARTQRYLGIIRDSGRQLLAQINDILDLARIEAGRIRVNPEPFDFGLLCQAALESAQREIRAKHLAAALERPPGAFVLNADERLVRQVVQNLVSNAVKFTPARGSVRLVLAALPGGGARLEVHDTGIGIPPEKLALLFKPFSQVDSSLSRHFGGTGLGLALVERIVRLHGGTLAVRSTPGQGSTFTAELPSAAETPPAAPPRAPRPRTVVLVDDDPRQHTLVGDYLQARGFDVTHCDTGAEALVAIAASEPGLAIVDINMPGLSGLELIARLRALPCGGTLPILAATALAETGEAERCRSAGADAHLPKPIALAALKCRIAELTGLAL